MTEMQIVVAAALTRPDGRLLMQRRRKGAHHGGLWEFPGGKAEAGEPLAAALARELHEELGIVVEPADCLPLTFSTIDADPGARRGGLLLLLYRVGCWRGTPTCLDAEELAWCAPDELDGLAMPPADVALMACLSRRGS